MTKPFITLALCCFCSVTALAQYRPMAPNMADVNRILSRNFMNMQMQMSLNRNWMFGFNDVNISYHFKVTMKDSTVKNMKSRIYADTTKHQTYVVFEDKKLPKSDPNRKLKIYPNQTLELSRMSGDEVQVWGTAADSCWLFSVVRGKINAYSPMPLLEEEVDDKLLSGYQIGTKSAIIKLDTAKLSPVIKSNPKAYKILQNGHIVRAINRYNKD